MWRKFHINKRLRTPAFFPSSFASVTATSESGDGRDHALEAEGQPPPTEVGGL